MQIIKKKYEAMGLNFLNAHSASFKKVLFLSKKN